MWTSKIRQRHGLRGITLVETLILTVLIIVFAAIFYPVRVTDGAYKTQRMCIPNLKQLGLATAMYSIDFDDRFPPATTWMNSMIPYFQSEEILHDPVGVEPGEYGYAFRGKESFGRVSEIRTPSELVLIFDSSLKGKNASGELWTLPSPGRHVGKDNLCFADGHVEAIGNTSDDNSPLAKILAADSLAGPTDPH